MTNPRTSCKLSSNFAGCKPWDLVTQTKTNDLADAYLQETLNIAGAHINVHMLMGIHEQTKLFDITGNGDAISGGDAPGYPAINAFNKLNHTWYSRQSGPQVINFGYVGYDFGIVKLPNNRRRYGNETSIRYEITTIKIKQSVNAKSRVTKVRVERSDDNVLWRGVAIVNLPDNDSLNTISFKQSAPSRYWRLRPIFFNGQECDSWGVQALEMHEFAATDISNIQDKILMENRDRDYNQQAILLRGYYDMVQANTDLQRFGIEVQASYNIKVNFNACVALLGRPLVIGDIIELPSETQFSSEMLPVKRYLEISDVTWDPGSYTPGWMPLLLLVTALPALASQETQDIFGDLASKVDSSGLFEDGTKLWQDFSNVDQAIKAKSLLDVPERGSEGSNVIREFEQDVLDAAALAGVPQIRKLGFNRTGLYVEDAIPQNQSPYTEGPAFPENPVDKEYHRLTYEGLSKEVPARLYRYSGVKQRWVYLETDRRQEFNQQKHILEEYTTSPTKTPARDIR
ncbi:hypothetical protein M0R04_07045 [Candidatus Dojkabacteria bacterium]|jgi:hypothetical protein|nr:hypothetical protein [Candidatus Dojkabacteria bacterium]